MSPKLHLSLLGDLIIQKDGENIEGLPSRAAEALLLYLACNRKSISREKLAELFWAERSATQSLTNLRTILTSLRKQVGDYLLVTRESLAIKPDGDIWLDIVEFESRLRELGVPDHASIPIDSLTANKLQEALHLYKGDFLEGFHLRDGHGFEEWVILQRERLKRLARDGFRLLTGYYLVNGNYTEGDLAASAWLHLDPYDEEACRSQMWMLIRTGQRNAALQCYQNLKDKLQKDLGVVPSSATVELFHKFEKIDFPPVINLPVYSTGFFGRRNEIMDIEGLLLSKETRLITMVGLGGIGKTRLAIEATRLLVERKLGRFLHGVIFIPLIAVETSQDIPARIAESVNLTFQGQDTLQKQLLDFLCDRESLLILDNLEHLFDEASSSIALIVEILRRAPGIKMIVTSRERLNLYDEVIIDVTGLDIPKNDTSVLEDHAATTLFLQCVRRIQRDYSPDALDKEAIARICRLVDGAPLAIELASSWIRNYSSQQIANQIESDLDFIASPYKDISPGHRSLRTVFERSWLLLTPEEQTIFMQLSVFRGGFNPEAVEAVVGDGNEENSSQIAILIEALADKSLLQIQPDGRIDIHPLLKQYAQEKLFASSLNLETVSAKHTSYYLNFLSGLGDGESPEQRALIRPERDNIRLAWEQAAFHGMFTELEKTAGPLHGFFSMQSWFQEGIDLFQHILDVIVRTDQVVHATGLVCDLLGRKARMHIQIGQLEKARISLKQALEHLEIMDDPLRRSRVLDSLAINNYYAGDYQQATILAEQSLHLSEQGSNLDGIAFSLNFLGSCAKAQGKYDLCRGYFERAVNAYRAVKDEVGAAMVLNNLGNLLQLIEDFEGAFVCYQQSSEIFKAQDHMHGAATTLANAGKLAIKHGNFDLARTMLNESLSMKRKINDRRGEAVALTGLGDIDLILDNLAEAEDYLSNALRLSQAIEDVQMSLDIITAMGELKLKQGEIELAQNLVSYIASHEGVAEEARQRNIRLMKNYNLSLEKIGAWNGKSVNEVILLIYGKA